MKKVPSMSQLKNIIQYLLIISPHIGQSNMDYMEECWNRWVGYPFEKVDSLILNNMGFYTDYLEYIENWNYRESDVPFVRWVFLTKTLLLISPKTYFDDNSYMDFNLCYKDRMVKGVHEVILNELEDTYFFEKIIDKDVINFIEREENLNKVLLE